MAEDVPGSLLSRAKSKVHARRPLCTFAVIYSQNATKEPEIRELLDNCGEAGERLPYSVVADTLNEGLGTKIDGQTVSRHVRGKCGCESA